MYHLSYTNYTLCDADMCLTSKAPTLFRAAHVTHLIINE